MSRARIAMVVTYFGAPPLWMPAFLLSCRHNPDVHWLIASDMAVTFPLPPNVTIIPMTLADLGRRASDALQMPFVITPDYLKKLSDIKMVGGLMFEPELRTYEFWGYSELDIIWGDIRRAVTDAILDTHDIVSGRHYRLAGHCTLFRNTERVNRLFEQFPGVRAALADIKRHRLDEHTSTGFLRARMAETPRPAFPRIFWEHDWTMKADEQRALGDAAADRLWWRAGRTFNAAGKELMYLHFHKLKQGMQRMAFGYDDRPEAFYLTREGVFPA